MATPSARPICRDMFRTPKPVANRLPGTTRAVRPKSDAWVRPTPIAPTTIPGRKAATYAGGAVDPHRPPRAAGGEQQAADRRDEAAPKRGTSLRTWTDTRATVNGPPRS